MAPHPFNWKPAFLASLRTMPVVAQACDAVGIERSTAYRARTADETFASAWDEAMEDGVDKAEQEAFRRGMVGFEEPVIDKGRLAYRYERYVDAEGAEHCCPRPIVSTRASTTCIASRGGARRAESASGRPGLPRAAVRRPGRRARP